MIKEELNKAFRMSNEEDEVWLICSDRMKNYKGYFASDNSCNLEEKFKASIRLQRQRASNLAAVDLAAVSIDAADNKLILARRNR